MAEPRVSTTAKLSLFWLAYFGGLGVFFPYFGLYLEQDLGLAPSKVGLVLAALPWIGLLAQPSWGRFADRHGRRRQVLGLALVATAVLYALLGVWGGFAGALLGTVALACFSTSVVPMAMAVSLAGLGRNGSSRFGLVRVWGTFGFLGAVIAVPWLLDRFDGLGPWQGLGLIFPLTALCTLAAAPWIFTLPPSSGLTVRSGQGDTRRLLRHSPVPRLFLIAFLAHLFLQAPIQLFPLLVTDRGGDVSWIREMWIYMLILEIPLVGFSGPSLRRIGARGLLFVGLVSEGLRWIATAYIHDFEIFRWIQLLHGIGVAGIMIGAPLYLEEAVHERSRASAQSLLATMTGLGTILSVALGGWIFERFGADVPYVLAGAGCLATAVAAVLILPSPWRPAEPE